MPRAFIPVFLPAVQAAWLLKSKSCEQIAGSFLISASGSGLISSATVSATDTTLAPAVTDILPPISNLTASVHLNFSDGGA